MHLTALWDMVARVMGQFDAWKQTLWDAIDVDFLVKETKKLLKEVKVLHKAIRNYPVYKCACKPTPLLCPAILPGTTKVILSTPMALHVGGQLSYCTLQSMYESTGSRQSRFCRALNPKPLKFRLARL